MEFLLKSCERSCMESDQILRVQSQDLKTHGGLRKGTNDKTVKSAKLRYH